MSKFLDNLGSELDRAARRRAARAHLIHGRWSRRTIVVGVAAALALIAVPAVAVTGVFRGSSPGDAGSTQPGVVDVGKPCVDKRTPTLDTTTAPPPAAVSSELAVLRRPQLPSDRYPHVDRLAMLPIQGVNPDAIRLATMLGSTRIYLIPAENVQYRHPLPDTEGCKRFESPSRAPVPGVCFVEHGAGASCTDVTGIKSGLSMMTSGGSNRGRTRVVGIAHDGVTAVIWRVHRGNRFLDTRVPVRNNVWAADVPGRHGHGLYVYFVTANGRELVRGPHRLTRRERAQRRLDARRDKTAGPIPTVVPRTGGTKTIFTFRMRLARPDPRKQYVANWTGPRGTSCAGSANNEIGMLPALRGPLRGLLKLPIGPPIATRRWCPGSYTGIVRAQRRGRTGAAGPVIATFRFSVRR